jgi:hypothetical protein
MTPDPDDKNLDALEAIFHDAALAAAEEGESTPEKQAWAAGVRQRLEQRVADMRRSLAPAGKPAKPIAARYLAMARDAVIARLEELVLGGRVQIAHRNLSALSDDDLRRLLESIDPDSH